MTATATFDHRTGATLGGGPASHYRRGVGCGDRDRPALTPVQRLSAQPAGPNYAARRLAALFVAISGVLVGAWVVGEVAGSLGGQSVSAASSASGTETGNEIVEVRIHVARSGDTLWSIAEEHRGEVGRHRYLDALETLNGATGSSIQVGQAIRLP